MNILSLNNNSDDATVRKICELYWDLHENNFFTHKVEDIAKQFKEKKGDITRKVKKNCSAVFNDLRCKDCNSPLILFYTRNDFIQFFNGFPNEINPTTKICNKCRIENDKEQLSRLKNSFENGTFETLSDLEFQFLLALEKNHIDLDVARVKVGISNKRAVEIRNDFLEKGILGYAKSLEKGLNDDYFFWPELRMALNKLNQKTKLKPIFHNKLTQDFYKKLKNEYLFVFPEIPLCTLVDKEHIEHLFLAPNDSNFYGNYFLNCRLDFVVCDENGYPKFAVELQGGYHADTKKAIQGYKFKSLVFETLGLPLYECPRDNYLVFTNSHEGNFHYTNIVDTF